MALETTFAKGSLDRVTLRDPNKRYYSLTPAELINLTPEFDWKDYFAGAGVPALERLTVTTPDFMKMLNAMSGSRCARPNPQGASAATAFVSQAGVSAIP